MTRGDDATVVESSRGGASDTQGRGGVITRSRTPLRTKTTASYRRARGGGVIDTLAKTNGLVLTAQWGDVAEEHGGDVGGGGAP